MYKKIRVNKSNINCYNNNCSGLFIELPFYLFPLQFTLYMPALLHFGAGFFMSKF